MCATTSLTIKSGLKLFYPLSLSVHLLKSVKILKEHSSEKPEPVTISVLDQMRFSFDVVLNMNQTLAEFFGVSSLFCKFLKLKFIWHFLREILLLKIGLLLLLSNLKKSTYLSTKG